jgi:integrase/recombinase XerD
MGKAFLEELERKVSERTARPLSDKTKKMHVEAVKFLFKALYVNEYLLANPFQGFSYKPKEEGKRRAILSQAEMAKVLDGIPVAAEGGPRDRTLYELLYGTGLRVEEVIKLRIVDLDFERRMLFVQGKGGRPRLQPVSEGAFFFLERYLKDQERSSTEPIFRGNSKGGVLSKTTINEHFKAWVKKAGIKRAGISTHSIRHSVATHLLENGAGIRYVQAFLGHESIKTTVIYTHTLYEKLKAVYKSMHPRENESYKEVDESYRERLEAFKRLLTFRQKITEKRREYNRALKAKRKAGG